MAASPRPHARRTSGALATLRSVFADYAAVEERRMFGHPAFFVKRRMFACVYGRALALKLPTARVSVLLQQKYCQPFRPYGKHMTRWVEIRPTRGVDLRNHLDSILAAMRFASRQAGSEARR